MADVRSIRIRRFKLLEDVALDLAPAIVLVGANNAGKSSVLQALHFATSVAQSARLAAGPNWQGDVYGVGFRPEQLIYAPSAEFGALGFRGRLIERRDTWIEVGIEETDGRRCLVAIGPGRNGNISLRIEGRDLGERIQDISRPYTVYAPGLAGIARSELALSQGVIRRTVARGDANLVLRNVLLWLFNRGEDWAQFQNDLREIFPGISLRVEFSDVIDEHIRVSFRRGDLESWLPLDCVGTSVLQAIQVLTYITLFKPRLLLLDEPDSHMHPDNQASMCRLLLRLARQRGFQAIIATHSRHVFGAMQHDVPIKWVSKGSVIAGVATQATAMLLEIGALDSLDLLANPQLRCVVMTEDQDTKTICSILESSGFRMDQTVIIGYGGCTKLDAVSIFSKFLRDRVPHVEILVHRDRDYMSQDDAGRYVLQLTGCGSVAFVTGHSDIEGYLLTPQHIHSVYPHVNIERASEILDQATVETREATIRDIINLRTEQAWRRRTGTRDQPNVGDIGVAAYAEYDGNPQAMRRGKRVLAQVRSILQQQLGGHANLDVPSPAISVPELMAVASRLWPPRHD
jgi:energy-coupling factor transporter ATP-binding protein EcfA2